MWKFISFRHGFATILVGMMSVLFTTVVQADNTMDLEKKYKEKVIPYFEQNAKRGEFDGKDGKKIRYAILENQDEKGALVIIKRQDRNFYELS